MTRETEQLLRVANHYLAEAKRVLAKTSVSMRHPIRGLLIGPLVAPVAYWIGVIASAWIRDVRLGWFQALRELAVIAAFGLPIAYTAALVWGDADPLCASPPRLAASRDSYCGGRRGWNDRR